MDDEFLRDLFAPIGPVTIKRMFGGKGIYADGKIIAGMMDGVLQVKGDDLSAPQYEAAGMARWHYTNAKTGKSVAKPYWAVPESAFDDPDEMEKWARLALETALRAAK